MSTTISDWDAAFDQALAAELRRRATRRRAAFWLLATAALTELVPASAGRRASLVATAANMGGLGLGALVAGLFAQYAPHPTTLVFAVYLAVLAVAGGCLLFVPETVSPRRRPALRLAGISLPEQGRGEFIAAGVAAFSAFSLLGLVLPVVGVGVASQVIGDFRSVLALSVLLAVLCVFARASTAAALAPDPEATR